MMRGVRIISIIVISTVFFGSFAFAESIGVNFGDPRWDALSPNQSAGAPGYEQTNWNNWVPQTGGSSSYTLFDNNGSDTGLKLKWQGSFIEPSGVSLTQGAASGGDETLFDGYAPATTRSGSPSAVNYAITGIPYAHYSVVIYVTGTFTGVKFNTVGGSGTLPNMLGAGYIDGNSNTPFTFLQDDIASSAKSDFGVMQDMVESSFTVGVSIPSNAQGGIAGFQIVNESSHVWAAPVSGDWTTASNWSPAMAPTRTTDTYFQTGSSNPYTVSLASSSASQYLSDQGDDVTIDTNGHDLNVTGSLIVKSNPSGKPGRLQLNSDADGNGSVSVARVVSVEPKSMFSSNIVVNGTISSNGVVAPGGAHPGTLRVNGDYVQGSLGELNVRIGDETSSSRFDSIAISGTARLSGNLAVTTPDFSNYPDARPAFSDSYKVLSAATTSGTFSQNASKLVESKSANGLSTGLFDVAYDTTGVTLSSFHQVHVLSFGIDDQDVNPVSHQFEYTIRGQAAAQTVHDAFASVPGVVDNTLVKLNSAVIGNTSSLEHYVSTIAPSLHAGDTFVFYINTHGDFEDDPNVNGGEKPIKRQIASVGSGEKVFNDDYTTTPTKLFLAKNEELTASQFSDLFADSQWANVNKLFVMDTCYAGGFWSDTGTIKYLSGLPHSAIIAAAPEELLSYGFTDGETPGGDLGIALASALNSLQGDLTFDKLVNEIYAPWDVLFAGKNGLVQTAAASGWGVPVTMPSAPTFVAYATSDFQLGMAGREAIPEPASAWLFAIGTFGPLLAQHRVRRVRR